MDGYTRLILHGEDDNVSDLEGAHGYEEGETTTKIPSMDGTKMHLNMI
jgi:hypothetical protein